jgi:hypothetical protein
MEGASTTRNTTAAATHATSCFESNNAGACVVVGKYARAARNDAAGVGEGDERRRGGREEKRGKRDVWSWVMVLQSSEKRFAIAG